MEVSGHKETSLNPFPMGQGTSGSCPIAIVICVSFTMWLKCKVVNKAEMDIYYIIPFFRM